MSPPRWISLACATVFFLTPSASVCADTAKLRAQLKLATEDDDTLSRIEILRRILDADPSDAASHRLLVELWLKVRDYDLAETTLKAWKDAPPDLAALTTAEVLRHRDDDTAGAIKVLSDYLATHPSDLVAQKALVGALLMTNDYAAQVKALDAVVGLERNAANLMDRAGAKFRAGDYSGAITDAREAAKLEPDASVVTGGLPQYERLEEALHEIDSLNAALDRDPRNPDALLARAWWYRYATIYPKTLSDAEAALALLPDSLIARIAKARALWMMDQLKAEDARRDELIDVTQAHALSTAREILKCDIQLAKNPKNARELAQRAHALNEARQFLLAQRDADAAQSLQPDVDAALEGLFATQMLGEDPMPRFRAIERMKPSKDQLAYAAGYIADRYFRQSNFPLALQFADQSLNCVETEYVLRVKAAALQRLGRADEANAAIRRANALRQ